MIQKLEIQGIHMTVDDSTRRYVVRKIGRLDRYLPKKVRDVAHAEVMLKESKAKDKNHCTCEVTLHLPKETINVKESTINMIAAIDIIETKLYQRIDKYKDMHLGKTKRHLLARLRNRPPGAD